MQDVTPFVSLIHHAVDVLGRFEATCDHHQVGRKAVFTMARMMKMCSGAAKAHSFACSAGPSPMLVSHFLPYFGECITFHSTLLDDFAAETNNFFGLCEEHIFLCELQCSTQALSELLDYIDTTVASSISSKHPTAVSSFFREQLSRILSTKNIESSHCTSTSTSSSITWLEIMSLSFWSRFAKCAVPWGEFVDEFCSLYKLTKSTSALFKYESLLLDRSIVDCTTTP